MAEFKVDTIKLREHGNDVLSLSNELSEILDSMYSRMNNITSVTHEWTGNAANEFIRRINIEEKYYNALNFQLSKYGELLVNLADNFDSNIRSVRIK